MARLVTIEMDKQRHMKFGINGLIQLEKELGRPLTEMSEGLSMEDFRMFLYVGLRFEDKKLTPEKVGDLMDDVIEERGMEYLSEKLGEAMGAMNATALPSEK